MIVYADTSALLKRLVTEDGSELAGEVWGAASRVISSELIYPEARAALSAMRRARRIDEMTLQSAVCRLERIHDDIELIRTDHNVAGLAGGLSHAHALRGSDAVHLAAALSFDSPRVVVTTWDRRLAIAAADRGMAVVPRATAPAAA